MGYTHHWYQDGELDADKFKKASADCKKLCKGSSIQFEYDDNKLPIFTNEQIRFNGIGEDGYEIFFIERVYKSSYPQTNRSGRYYSFCKTAQKLYDRYVVACLIILKHYLGDSISISSDGDIDDWSEGKTLCIQVLGYGDSFKFY